MENEIEDLYWTADFNDAPDELRAPLLKWVSNEVKEAVGQVAESAKHMLIFQDGEILVWTMSEMFEEIHKETPLRDLVFDCAYDWLVNPIGLAGALEAIALELRAKAAQPIPATLPPEAPIHDNDRS